MLLAKLRMLVVHLIALGVLLWPALSYAQSKPVGEPGRRPAALSVGPGATAGGGQIRSAVELTGAVKETFNSLIDRFRRGESVADEAGRLREQLRQEANSEVSVMFRVGMFFEHVTLGMLALFSQSKDVPCDTALVQVVEADLQALERDGAGNGAVFGRSALATRCRVPGPG